MRVIFCGNGFMADHGMRMAGNRGADARLRGDATGERPGPRHSAGPRRSGP